MPGAEAVADRDELPGNPVGPRKVIGSPAWLNGRGDRIEGGGSCAACLPGNYRQVSDRVEYVRRCRSVGVNERTARTGGVMCPPVRNEGRSAKPFGQTLGLTVTLSVDDSGGTRMDGECRLPENGRDALRCARFRACAVARSRGRYPFQVRQLGDGRWRLRWTA